MSVTEHRRDPLTGLADREAYDERLADELARLTEHDRGLAVVHFDVDRFAGVNDARGRAAADHALRCVAAVLEGACRRSDAVFRFGADEFALLLPRATTDDARSVAARVAARLRATALGLTMSYGVASADSRDARRVQEAADAALGAAKRGATSAGRP
jgi:diguanylate cyclase